MITSPETIRSEKCWYAVYTRSRHEKAAAGLLSGRGVECFLPLVRVLSQWQDRRKWVEKPLFPGYLFVRVHVDEIPAVWGTRGVVRLLGPERSRLSTLPDAEVESIRHLLESGVRLDPYPYLKPGQQVCITRGPLRGVEGTLIRKSRKCLLVISVNILGRAVVAEVSAEDVQGL